MTDERASLSGKMLDKYELLEKVGEGGMAEVYRGRHSTLGREVAVKLLHPHLSASDRNRARFEREARAVASLEHENILQIFDYSGKDYPTCYIVTEFIDGLTLKELLGPEGKLPSEVAAIIAIELCKALTYAHSRGIVHRDIKPENVMIRRDGVVKLMDFGIARVLDDSTTTLTGGLVGSPAYMSPEQASDLEVDLRSDIFALGTLLYRMVTGHLPFVGRSTPTILRNIIDGNYLDPLDVEAGLDPMMAEIIRRALRQDPAERYESARELSQELSTLLSQAELAGGEAEIKRYLDNPHEYEAWLRAHLTHVLTGRGRRLIDQGNSVAAMKLFNRVLCLDENNETVARMLQELHQPRRNYARYVLAACCALVIPLGALVAVGLHQEDGLLSGLAGPEPAVRHLPPVAPDSEGALLDPVPVDPAALEPTPAELGESRPSTPAPTVDPTPVRSPVLAPAVGESRVLPIRGLPPGESSPRKPLKERIPPAQPGKTPEKASPPEGRQATAQAIDTTPVVVQITAIPYARIFIDGRSYDSSLRKDPILLPPGSYRLRLENPLCEVLEDTIVVKPGRPFERTYELTLLPARLVLRNLPVGTELFLDQDRLGTWPSISQPIPIRNPRKSHTVRARLPDGSQKEWSIPELNPKAEFVVDGTGLLP